MAFRTKDKSLERTVAESLRAGIKKHFGNELRTQVDKNEYGNRMGRVYYTYEKKTQPKYVVRLESGLFNQKENKRFAYQQFQDKEARVILIFSQDVEIVSGSEHNKALFTGNLYDPKLTTQIIDWLNDNLQLVYIVTFAELKELKGKK